MNFRKMPAAVMAGALLSCMGWNTASAQMPGSVSPYVGRIYSLHTRAVGGCPAMDWAIRVGENRTLSGTIGSASAIFRVEGAFNPDGSFHLDGKEMGGTRTGAINGQIRRRDGMMLASIGGLMPDAPCQGKTVSMRWNIPSDAVYTGGGGG